VRGGHCFEHVDHGEVGVQLAVSKARAGGGGFA
jgi:hypothetical protein